MKKLNAFTLALLLIALILSAFPLLADSNPLATNTILFIGDGMGPVHVDLARKSIDGQSLAMDAMPITARVNTRSLDGVTDSAAAATALSIGRRTKNGMLGVTPEGRHEHLLQRAKSMYKSAGVVVTDSLHGATPAGFIVHVDSRNKRAEISKQIANSNIDVMMGFWRGWFLPKSAGGEREDGLDLLAQLRQRNYNVVFNEDELLNSSSPKLAGFFGDHDDEPSLAQLVTVALERLSANPNGFILVVEEARIDWESHNHRLTPALQRVLHLDEAVSAALKFAQSHPDTLVIVTADHETGGLALDKSWSTTGHTSTPVPLFASGPGAARFQGDLHLTDIPRLIADAMGLGPFPR